MNKTFGDFNPDSSWLFELIPVPYDKTTSYEQGTSLGPAAVIEASQELEFYDDECDLDPSEHGIKTLPAIDIPLQDANTEHAFKELEELCQKSYANKKFPIVLGGEHSLSLAPIKAAYEQAQKLGTGLTLLHFDAHEDLRDQYLDNPYSHAAVIYQVLKHCPEIKIVSVGIRNISQGEIKCLRKWGEDFSGIDLSQFPVKIFYAREELRNSYAYLEDLVSLGQKNNGSRSRSIWQKENLNFNKSYITPWTQIDVMETIRKIGNKNLYISFDVDGFDSALMPATGTPEPGGLDWFTPINIIRESIKEFNLLGADVVELSPREGMHASDFLVAKLIYKIMAYHCKYKN